MNKVMTKYYVEDVMVQHNSTRGCEESCYCSDRLPFMNVSMIHSPPFHLHE